MTRAAQRRALSRRLPFRMQVTGVLVALAASLAALSLPGLARADTGPGYDQMTGVGATASAVTVPWTQGLLGPDNKPIAGANDDRSSANPTSPLSFMYNDFKNLQVTVSQTEDIAHQGVTVNWSGGKPTIQTGTTKADFLQMMECYGDASTGPTPAQCEYGARGLLPPGASNPGIGQRTGNLCVAGAAPSTTNPPITADGSNAIAGCDTQEPSDPTHIAPCPSGTTCGSPTNFTIPFAPVSDPTNLDYSGGTTYFDEFNTNEVPVAVTGPDGTGQRQFETLTGSQASGLGCGEADGSSPRGCWLVIVPRGEYEPNGFHVDVNSGNGFLRDSPLSKSNWDQRIQIHLGFAPLASFCPIGTTVRKTVGTQVITRAMQSWQLALNQAAKCAKVYGYSAVPETTSTDQLSADLSQNTAGLAFTTIPIGSEGARPGGSGVPANLPNIVYAPVAVTALDFGFNINYGSAGQVTTPVKLTPMLTAKALTQSYRQDLPDYFPDLSGHTGPAWAQSNPDNISKDPTFQALNPEVPPNPTGPLAPLLTEDHSGLNQQYWQWVQGDSTAAGWLGGTADAADQNMTVDPDYKALNLGQAPALDSFPRAYTGKLDLGLSPDQPPKEEVKLTLDLLPYTDNYDSAAAAVLGANNPDESGAWDTNARAPDGSGGYWDKAGVETPGSVWMWAADDTPDLAAYGLIPAQLCNGSASACIGPSVASVGAALSGAKADSSGLLHVDPANPGSGAYPLVDVVYAAVRTDQAAASLSDYADLIAYAAGTGQTTGAVAGDLPPGYLPLTDTLKTQAQNVVTQLRALASGSPSPSASTSSPPGGSQTTGDTGSSTGDNSGGGNPSTGTGTNTGTGTGGVTLTNSPAPTPAPAAGNTPAANNASAPLTSPVTNPASLPAATSAASRSHPAAAVSPATPSGPVTSGPAAQQAAGVTPEQAVGNIRWALLGIALAGGGLAGGGTLLRSGGIPLWIRRRLL